MSGDELDWQADSTCGKRENQDKMDFFFSSKASERAEAKKLCGVCPVRRECAKWALEEKQVWGVWGSLDEVELRRTLSVNADGMEIRRDRYPRCPGCKATCESLTTKTAPRPGGGRWATMRVVICVECNFTWAGRTSANAVDAYHAKKLKKKKK